VKHAASVRPEPGSNSPTKTRKRPDKSPKDTNKNFHWLQTSTLLSSQTTNTHRDSLPICGQPVSGATPLRYPCRPTTSTIYNMIIVRLTRAPSAPFSGVSFGGSRRPAGLGSEDHLRRPAPAGLNTLPDSLPGGNSAASATKCAVATTTLG